MYTNNKISETEIRKKIPFDVATRKIKYLGINLTKEVKELYSENYTTLKKEIKEDTNKRKHVPCSWTGRINVIINLMTSGQDGGVGRHTFAYQRKDNKFKNKK